MVLEIDRPSLPLVVKTRPRTHEGTGSEKFDWKASMDALTVQRVGRPKWGRAEMVRGYALLVLFPPSEARTCSVKEATTARKLKFMGHIASIDTREHR